MLSDLPTTRRYSSGSLWGQPDSRLHTLMAGLLDFPHTARQVWKARAGQALGPKWGCVGPTLGPGEMIRLPESASVSPFLLVSALGFLVPSPLLLWSSWPWSLLAPALVPPTPLPCLLLFSEPGDAPFWAPRQLLRCGCCNLPLLPALTPSLPLAGSKDGACLGFGVRL